MENKSSTKFVLTVGLKLLAICGAVALILALINSFTSPVIAAKEAEEKDNTIHSIFPDMTRSETSDYTDENTNKVYLIYRDDTLLGYCCDVSAQGFSDTINMMVGIDGATGKITQTSIVSITDAPGKDKVNGSDFFLPQFIQKSGTLSFGNEVDAISGATYSSNGVLQCINAATNAAAKVAENQKPVADTDTASDTTETSTEEETV